MLASILFSISWQLRNISLNSLMSNEVIARYLQQLNSLVSLAEKYIS